jgi:hypothetical protein
LTPDKDGRHALIANGTGDDEFSTPILFYFDNATSINEWAKLMSPAREAQDSWLRRHGNAAVSEVADELGLRHEFVADPHETMSLLVLPGTPEEHGRPMIGIGLGWLPDDLMAPYDGIAIDKQSSSKPALSLAVSRRLRLDGLWSEAEQHEEPWPAWHELTIGEAWWLDLDGLSDRIKDGVRREYDRFHSSVAKVLEEFEIGAPADGSAPND